MKKLFAVALAMCALLCVGCNDASQSSTVQSTSASSQPITDATEVVAKNVQLFENADMALYYNSTESGTIKFGVVNKTNRHLYVYADKNIVVNGKTYDGDSSYGIMSGEVQAYSERELGYFMPAGFDENVSSLGLDFWYATEYGNDGVYHDKEEVHIDEVNVIK